MSAEVTQLKAEIYDLSKQMQQMQQVLAELGKVTNANTVEELIETVNKLVARASSVEEKPKRNRGNKEAVEHVHSN